MARGCCGLSGERNYRAKDPDALVRRARELYVPGRFGPDRIAKALSPVAGRRLHRETVRQWISGANRASA